MIILSIYITQKERINAEYLEIIGYEYLITSIEASINSATRIYVATQELKAKHPLLFKCIAEQNYLDNVYALGVTANMLVLSYDRYLIRVRRLREKFYDYNKLRKEK